MSNYIKEKNKRVANEKTKQLLKTKSMNELHWMLDAIVSEIEWRREKYEL